MVASLKIKQNLFENLPKYKLYGVKELKEK